MKTTITNIIKLIIFVAAMYAGYTVKYEESRVIGIIGIVVMVWMIICNIYTYFKHYEKH